MNRWCLRKHNDNLSFGIPYSINSIILSVPMLLVGGVMRLSIIKSSEFRLNKLFWTKEERECICLNEEMLKTGMDGHCAFLDFGSHIMRT